MKKSDRCDSGARSKALRTCAGMVTGPGRKLTGPVRPQRLAQKNSACFSNFSRVRYIGWNVASPADLRPEGLKTQMPVQSLLPGRPGNDAQVVTMLDAELPHQRRQAAEHLPVAELLFDREQADSQARRPGGR